MGITRQKAKKYIENLQVGKSIIYCTYNHRILMFHKRKEAAWRKNDTVLIFENLNYQDDLAYVPVQFLDWDEKFVKDMLVHGEYIIID